MSDSLSEMTEALVAACPEITAHEARRMVGVMVRQGNIDGMLCGLDGIDYGRQMTGHITSGIHVASMIGVQPHEVMGTVAAVAMLQGHEPRIAAACVKHLVRVLHSSSLVPRTRWDVFKELHFPCWLRRKFAPCFVVNPEILELVNREGLMGLLEFMRRELDDDAITALLPNVRAIAAFLALTDGDNAHEAKAVIAAVGGARCG